MKNTKPIDGILSEEAPKAAAVNSPFRTFSDDWGAFYESLGDGTNDLIGLKSDIDFIDKGFLGLRYLTVLMGNSGAGKSSLLALICTNLARQGKRILYLSMEMPLHMIHLYMMRAITAQSLSDIELKGKINFPEKIEDLEYANILGNINIARGIDFIKLRDLHSKLEADIISDYFKPFDFIAVDSIQSLPELYKGQGEYVKIGEWMQILSDCSSTARPIWAISQSSKSADANAKEGQADLHDGRGSAAIGYIASFSIRLTHNNEKFGEQIGIEVLNLKNRMTGTDEEKPKIWYNPKTGQFT